MPSYYESLNIDSNASVDVIETAIDNQYNQFRQLINHHDPNVVDQANRALRQLEDIRSTLTNPVERAKYDRTLNFGGLVDPTALLQVASVSAMASTPPAPKLAVREDAGVTTWKCEQCGKVNRIGSNVCTQCGNVLARDCPNGCGNVVRLDEKYCSKCGKGIDETLEKLRLDFEQAQKRCCDDISAKIQSKRTELDRLNWFSRNLPLFGNGELRSLLGQKIPVRGWFLVMIFGLPVLVSPIFVGPRVDVVMAFALFGPMIGLPLILYVVALSPRVKARAREMIAKSTAQRQEYIRHAESRLKQEQAKTFDPLSPKPYVPDVIGAPAWEVVLTSAGNQKVNVVWIIRLNTELGVREAKDLVESAPSTICTTTDKNKADSIKSSLEKAGASVSVVARTALPR